MPTIVPDQDLAQQGRALETDGASDAGEHEISEHLESQHMLAKLGSDMGLNIWIAANDKSRTVGDQKLADLPGRLPHLPVRFNDGTQRIIELIDLLWIDRNRIVAAFEIECTTSVSSGLLRMSDLVTLQPHALIPMFVVAPARRRAKVFREIGRPTFSALETPLYRACRFLALECLRDEVRRIGPYVRHMTPDFLDAIAEEAPAPDCFDAYAPTLAPVAAPSAPGRRLHQKRPDRRLKDQRIV